MTEKEYLQELKLMIRRIRAGEGVRIEDRLMELYNYKPVRLLWQIAYGELLASQGKKEEAREKLAYYHFGGTEYPGIKELENLHKEILCKDEKEKQMLEYVYGNEESRSTVEGSLNDLFIKYIENDSLENLERLMNGYYTTKNWIVYLIIRMKLLKLQYIKNTEQIEWNNTITNYAYFERALMETEEAVILIADSYNQKECDLLSNILYELNHQVYLLLPPEQINTELIHTENLAEICIQNSQKYEDAIAIPVLEIEDAVGKRENNRAEIIKYLYEKVIKNRYAITIASGTVFDELIEQPIIQKNIECLTDMFGERKTFYFGWAGNYLNYISELYKFDVEKRLEEKAICDFSIVIPARNSAGTLYYTLQTCLNQDYKGCYEIIVSDNSTNGQDEVWRVCRDLDDKRIRYVKTPRDLHLTKSFEFAFLQAKGEFILSLGSDDGICPWALSSLSKIIKQYPGEEVLSWKRGYYVWQGYPGHKENEFVIPGQFDRENIDCHYISQIDYFAKVLKYSFNMYSLPTMYVNSGFHRSYLKTLLAKTGRLWDGCNQDLYMGVISAAINEQILHIDFPLTMVGISSNSLGYLGGISINKNSTNKDREEIIKSAMNPTNEGVYTLQGITKEMAVGKGETNSLYLCILRAIQLGALPDTWRTELLDYKKIFTEFFEEHICTDDYYDKYLHHARYIAEQRGEIFLKWFDEAIYNPAVLPKYYKKQPESAIKVKSYQEGIDREGQLVLDASKYGVTNIAEAVKLFSELVYWTPETYEKELEKKRIND